MCLSVERELKKIKKQRNKKAKISAYQKNKTKKKTEKILKRNILWNVLKRERKYFGIY